MYLSRKMNTRFKPNPASAALVSNTGRGKFGAVSSSEQQNVPIFAPYGVSYLPNDKDQLLLVNVSGTEVCVGTLSDYSNLHPGELKLQSQGGAVIHLKTNGDVVINGLTITRDGVIIHPA